MKCKFHRPTSITHLEQEMQQKKKKSMNSAQLSYKGYIKNKYQFLN